MYQMRLSYSSNILFLTSNKGQPLNKGQNGQKTMGPKRVRLFFRGSAIRPATVRIAQLPNYVDRAS